MRDSWRTSLILVLAFSHSAAWGAERPTAKELLNGLRYNCEKLSRARLEGVEATPESPAGNGVIQSAKSDVTILRDGSQWKVDRTVDWTKIAADGDRTDQGWREQTLAGTELVRAQLSHAAPGDPPPRPILTVYRDEHSNRAWSSVGLARVAFGHLEGDDGNSLWDVMQGGASLEIHPEAENIHGVQCWRVTSRGRYGVHQVWFPIDATTFPVQIVIEKQTGDLYNDEQLGSRTIAADRNAKPKAKTPNLRARGASSIRIEGIQVARHGAASVPQAFEYKQTESEAGREQVLIRTFALRSIDIDPQPFPPSAFQFDIEIPNGLIVGVFTNLPLEYANAVADEYLEWFDGKLRKRTGSP